MRKGPRIHEETLLLFPAERDGSVEARCPVCREGLEAVPCRLCPKCDTPHHAACWEYLGSCAVFACGGKTPPRPAPVRNITTYGRPIPDMVILEEPVHRPPARPAVEDRGWGGRALMVLSLVFMGTLLPLGFSLFNDSAPRSPAPEWMEMNEPRESRGALEFWLRDS